MSNGWVPIRVAIDTNVFISSLIRSAGAPFEVIERLRAGQITLVWSEEQRLELRDVVQRPALQRHIRSSLAVVLTLLRELDETATIAPPQPAPVPVRDPDDEAILAAAFHGGADYLITGDADLLVLADDPALGSLRIVTAAQFLATT